jgi:rubrerythrin
LPESPSPQQIRLFRQQAKKEGLEQISGFFAETALNEKDMPNYSLISYGWINSRY